MSILRHLLYEELKELNQRSGMCDVTILLSTIERHGHIPATIKCEIAAQNNIAIDAICFIVNVDELQCPRLIAPAMNYCESAA